VFQRLDDGNVRVLELRVLANQRNVDALMEPFHAIRKLLPLVEQPARVRVVPGFHLETVHDDFEGSLGFEEDGDVVHAGAVVDCQDVFRWDVAEHGDFALDRIVELFRASAGDLFQKIGNPGWQIDRVTS